MLACHSFATKHWTSHPSKPQYDLPLEFPTKWRKFSQNQQPNSAS